MAVDRTGAGQSACDASEGRAAQARLWLGAGAVTLGMGAAMLGGAAIAAADPGESAAGSASAGSSDSSDASSSDTGSASRATSRDDTAGPRPRAGAVTPSDDSDDEDSTEIGRDPSSSDEPSDVDEALDAAHEESTGDADTSGDVETSTGEVDTEVESPTIEEDGEIDPGASAGPHTFPASGTSTSGGAPQPAAADSAPAIDVTTPVRGTSAAAPAISGTSPGSTGSAGATTVHAGSSTVTSAAPTGHTTAPSPAVVPTAVATAARNPFGLPTPSQLLRGLQDFGAGLYVTVMNQLYGLQRSLTMLRDDVRSIVGFTQQVITRALPFGDPNTNVQYFTAADDFITGALATVAMAYGQLTKTVVNLQSFLDAATNTDSIITLGSKVLGPDTSIVYWQDSYEVLQDRDVRIILRSYGRDQWSKAFNDLTNGLQDPTKAMIVPIVGPADGRTDPIAKTVVVIGVDNVDGTVTINDPTRADGQGLTMGYDDFMNAWAAQNYKLVTTQLASSPNVAPADSKSKWVWKLPSVQHVASGIAAAFVHQVQVLSENITDLGGDLSRTFGVAQPEPIDPPAIGDIEYGNYLANYQYWKYQGNFGTCALMSTAAVIAQLTGNGMPVDMVALAREVQTLAETLPSGIKVGQSMYTEGLGGTYLADVVTLLNKFGINADHTTYLKTEGSLALDNMTAALSQGQSVIVALNNKLVYDAWNKQYFGEDYAWYRGSADQANHAVTVLSVNMTKGVVYINDSAPRQGQGLAVPLDQFMKAWEVGSFDLTTAELAGGAAG